MPPSPTASSMWARNKGWQSELTASRSGRFPVKTAARARCHRIDRLVDRADVLGRGAAAAADDIDQPFLGKLAQQARGDVGRFVKTGVAHRVGQAEIGR